VSNSKPLSSTPSVLATAATHQIHFGPVFQERKGTLQQIHWRELLAARKQNKKFPSNQSINQSTALKNLEANNLVFERKS
jgi:hypothetical protein